METLNFVPDSKTKGFSVEVPNGALKTIEIQDAISKHYKEFLDSDVEKSKNAGENLTKILLGLGVIAISYFSGKQILKEMKKVDFETLKSMSVEDAMKWIHDASLSDLDELCNSDEDVNKLYSFVIESVADILPIGGGTEWKNTSKGFKDFIKNHNCKFTRSEK